MAELKYKRVLLKLSGEALAGNQKNGVDAETVGKICDKVKEIVDLGVQVAIVVGGGNFWRGRNGHQMERTTADYMGMLATAMNGLALQDALETRGIHSRVQTAIEMREIAEPFIQRKAEKHLNRGRVVIFACGTGHPYFTTDTAAVLRAIEIKADIILLGKAIDAVYSADPKIEPDATKFEEISYLEVLNKDLKVMDSTATAETVGKICDKVKEIVDLGVQVAIVVGGGNFWRGRNGHQMERTTADYMGMLATAMNGLALQDALETRGIHSRVQTAIEMREIAEPFIQRKAEKHLNRGRVVIFACGTGHPYFTTDTAAVLRAIEIKADIILLGKAIDAVYSADPKIEPDATKFEEISYLEVLNKDLKVMDSTATAMCRDNNIPLLVFGIADPENIVRAVKGEKIGTIVS